MIGKYAFCRANLFDGTMIILITGTNFDDRTITGTVHWKNSNIIWDIGTQITLSLSWTSVEIYPSLRALTVKHWEELL